MKFSVSSKALAAKLSAIARVINSKNALPILSDIVFSVQGEELELMGSDSENWLQAKLPINETDGQGRFCVGAHSMMEAIKSISDQPITIDVRDGRLTVTHSSGRFSLPTEEAAEFPVATSTSGANVAEASLSPEVMLVNICRSLFATASDELRPVMNGICFDFQADYLAIVASDGHKLVRSKMLSVTTEKPASFILAKKPAGILKGILKGVEGMLSIRFDEKVAVISSQEFTLTCRLIDGRYPNYNSVIPQFCPNVATVERQALAGALRRIVPFANDSSCLVRFEVKEDMMKLDAEDYDFSKTATEKVHCEYSGKSMAIGFKGSTFEELLGNLTCSQVRIELSDPSRAGLIVPVEQKEDEDVLMLIMPMLIND